MEKLSEAGKLYLKDIYILEEARKDAFDYLNYIADQVFEKWEAYKDDWNSTLHLPAQLTVTFLKKVTPVYYFIIVMPAIRKNLPILLVSAFSYILLMRFGKK